MNTYNKIKEIFYSGGFAFTGVNESISEIAFLVDEGYLSFELIEISDKKTYLDLLKNFSDTKDNYDASGGSKEHVALKMSAGEYLRSKRSLDVDYEWSFCGYYPDVITKDRKVIVECGHTQNSEKILTYFKQGKIDELIQLPYPDYEDEVLKAYSFKVKRDFSEFLNFVQEEKNVSLRDMINKGRNSLS